MSGKGKGRVSREFRPMCHRNSVPMDPQRSRARASINTMVANEFAAIGDKSLDMGGDEGYNYNDTHGQNTSTRFQGRLPQSRRRPPPSAQGCPGRGILPARVLRSPRPRSGPLRDASAPPNRGKAGRPGCPGLRYEPTGLLCQTRPVPGPWPAGARSQAAWSPACSQMLRGASRLRRAVACRSSRGRRAGPRAGPPGTLRHHRPPPLDRSGAGSAEKKTPTLRPALVALEIDSVGCYERMRQEALSARTSHGLHLFLNRGMAAWLETLAVLEAPRLQSAPGPQPEIACSSRPELVALWAEMILKCTQEVNAWPTR